MEFDPIPLTHVYSKYTLKGKYGPNNMGWFGNYAYIYLEVGGDVIPDNYRVVTWMEMDNPYSPGNFEAFECVAIYHSK